MKILAVSGVSGSGKTTVIEMIIKELKARGYRVGSIKDIHFEDFAIDQKGSNTWRHVQAGAEQVIARGFHETDILIPKRMEYEELIRYFDQDFLVMEGMPEAKVPRILCAHSEEELTERWTDQVFAVSGRIADKIGEFNEKPVVNALTRIKDLVDLLEVKALVCEQTNNSIYPMANSSKTPSSFMIRDRDNMNWLSLVEENCGIKILKWEKFFSRRNEVFAVEGLGGNAQSVKYAVKIYRQEEAFQEPLIMRELASACVKVPKVIWYNENIMVTEFISGTVLADLLDENDAIKTNIFLWMDLLACWFYQLHSVKKFQGRYFSMPDLNLRNFIFDGRDFFGLDFEESVFHEPERDLGGLAAFILNSDPMFESWKFDAVSHFVQAYGKLRKINIEAVKDYFFAEMEKAAERRKGQQDYLRKKIAELKANDFFSLGSK